MKLSIWKIVKSKPFFAFSSILIFLMHIFLLFVLPEDGLRLEYINPSGDTLLSKNFNEIDLPEAPRLAFRKGYRVAVYGYIYLNTPGEYTLNIKSSGIMSGYFIDKRYQEGNENVSVSARIENPNFYRISIYKIVSSRDDILKISIKDSGGKLIKN